MGEVWKARDTRLDRDVAIKLAAEQFSDRFEREERAIAAQVQASTSGGVFPQWRDDGKELFYVNHNRLTAVPVQLGSTPRLGAPQPLFQIRAPAGSSLSGASYKPSRDGQRFLIADTVGGEDTPPPLLTVVLNWQTNLKNEQR
jgi:serine/threonine-protein kinase